MSEPFWEPLSAVPVPPVSSSVWMPGDTKLSAQTTTHADPTGGTWYLADGSALPVGETALIAKVGANLPDARGRGLVMLGASSYVNAVGKDDGITDPAQRSPVHKHSFGNPTVASHSHGGGYHDHGGGYHGHYYHTTGMGENGPQQVHTICFGEEARGTYYNNTAHLAPNYAGITAQSVVGAEAPGTSGGTVGPQTVQNTDSPAFTVVGNLFYHS